MEKLAQKYSPNLSENNAQTPKFIGSEKLAVGVLSGLSVDRPVDRQRSKIRPLEPPVDRPVTQKNREHCSQFWSTGSVDRPSARSRRARRARRSTDFNPSRLDMSTSRLS